MPNDPIQNSTKVLFRQIILYLVLSSGMGDPSQPDVYNEAECALASVLSQEDLLKFIKLTRYKKSLELEEMNKLLVGIRLFNNMRRLGGAGIDDMPQLLTKAAFSMETILNESIGRIECKLTPLEKAFEMEYEWDSKNKNFLLRSKRSPFGSNDVKLAKELLCLWQQISFYLNVIKQNIKTHLTELENVKEALNKRLTSLIEHTKCKVAIETSVIYPQFRKVFKYWKTFQEMLILYSVYNKLLKTMMQYAKVKTIPKWVLKIVNRPLDFFEEETIGEVISQQLVLQDVIYPENNEVYTLEMGGFCPTYALLAEGVVLKARPQIGIVKFAGKYYGFRNVKAAYFFCKNPDLVIKQIVDMVRTKPEYIELLQLRTAINQFTYPFAAGIPFNTKVLTSSDKSVQTDIHPMPSIIDPKHRSSTWQLKEDACQLANILKMRTHSMQTDLSHFAYDIGTQVNLPKAVEVQTMTDNYTNTPKLQNFLYGLRGQKEDNQHTVILTRPVEEGF
ncbi:cilia- and flagella-associated protein 206-like isoform X2 [Cimex lectularius]|nr:cilia- and flagella-associated protein 206-like isoform X2 [Cimex lectularius]